MQYTANRTFPAHPDMGFLVFRGEEPVPVAGFVFEGEIVEYAGALDRHLAAVLTPYTPPAPSTPPAPPAPEKPPQAEKKGAAKAKGLPATSDLDPAAALPSLEKSDQTEPTTPEA